MTTSCYTKAVSFSSASDELDCAACLASPAKICDSCLREEVPGIAQNNAWIDAMSTPSKHPLAQLTLRARQIEFFAVHLDNHELLLKLVQTLL